VTPISIRKAQQQDAKFLAWAILTATRSHLPRGWFDIALNRTESECLEFLKRLTTTRARSQWHYSRFLVADGLSGTAAAISAAPAGDAYSMAPIALRETLRACGLSPAERELFWKRGAYLFTCTTRPDDSCLTVEVLATRPEERAQGYTAALLARAFEDGRAQGLREAHITCFIGNLAAERAYGRAGFRLVDERRHSDFEAVAGAPGIRQFVRTL